MTFTQPAQLSKFVMAARSQSPESVCTEATSGPSAQELGGIIRQQRPDAANHQFLAGRQGGICRLQLPDADSHQRNAGSARQQAAGALDHQRSASRRAAEMRTARAMSDAERRSRRAAAAREARARHAREEAQQCQLQQQLCAADDALDLPPLRAVPTATSELQSQRQPSPPPSVPIPALPLPDLPLPGLPLPGLPLPTDPPLVDAARPSQQPQPWQVEPSQMEPLQLQQPPALPSQHSPLPSSLQPPPSQQTASQEGTRILSRLEMAAVTARAHTDKWRCHAIKRPADFPIGMPDVYDEMWARCVTVSSIRV